MRASFPGAKFWHAHGATASPSSQRVVSTLNGADSSTPQWLIDEEMDAQHNFAERGRRLRDHHERKAQ